MSLGETICRLRTERALSQGDLAELLDVSRQSISKWETNSSVPELDKLVRLSELFDITLDELVRGAPPKARPEAGPTQVIIQQAAPAPAPSRTAGIILLCAAGVVALLCGVLGGLLEGVVLALPFLLCGLICLFCRRRAGLWCGWAMFAMVDLYLRFATGISWGFVRNTFRFWETMTIQIIMAWVMLLFLLLLIGLTLFSFRKREVRLTGQTKWLFLGGWALFFVLQIPLYWLGARYLRVTSILTDWVRMPLLIWLLVTAVCALRTRKKEPKRNAA